MAGVVIDPHEPRACRRANATVPTHAPHGAGRRRVRRARAHCRRSVRSARVGSPPPSPGRGLTSHEGASVDFPAWAWCGHACARSPHAPSRARGSARRIPTARSTARDPHGDRRTARLTGRPRTSGGGWTRAASSYAHGTRAVRTHLDSMAPAGYHHQAGVRGAPQGVDRPARDARPCRWCRCRSSEVRRASAGRSRRAAGGILGAVG